ncbi:hypothetical protein LguiB_020674 [Lonicera macranthoides]
MLCHQENRQLQTDFEFDDKRPMLKLTCLFHSIPICQQCKQHWAFHPTTKSPSLYGTSFQLDPYFQH